MSIFDNVNPADEVGNVDVSMSVCEGTIRLMMMANSAIGLSTASAAGGSAATAGGAFGTATAVGSAGTFVSVLSAPVIAALLGLYGIARARARGRQGARRNAFIAAFAAFVVGASHGEDIRKRNAIYADASIKGRNAAIRVLTAVSPARRRECLSHFRGMGQSVARARIVSALGGYTTG